MDKRIGEIRARARRGYLAPPDDLRPGSIMVALSQAEADIEYLLASVEELSRDRDELWRRGHAAGLADAPSRRTRWIPVTERLPEDGVRVLVVNGGDEMAVALVHDVSEDVVQWMASAWRGREGAYLFPPATHWMPLPEPPESASELSPAEDIENGLALESGP